ncbi:hypothetical protein EVG20_g11102 [Dentipellis fragilis]|uniref:Uncharacterized protein n=1 Tax=Dentipellis fragilis TaxID=205917 RepID=A0A4Y9XPD4_9AGAM|nr:hypothetical protein EVG20_g11102 [Dentipellis fragilis]
MGDLWQTDGGHGAGWESTYAVLGTAGNGILVFEFGGAMSDRANVSASGGARKFLLTRARSARAGRGRRKRERLMDPFLPVHRDMMADAADIETSTLVHQ